MKKRILSMILVLVMILSAIPVLAENTVLSIFLI